MATMFRDLQCAADVGKMAELGRFEQEFIVYGCTYQDQGRIKYRVSDESRAIYDFIAQSAAQGLYPTPVNKHFVRTLVPSGMQEDILLEVKMQLAQQMKRSYGPTYFTTFMPFAETAPNDLAYGLLAEQRELLEGRFQQQELKMFEGAVQLAYEAKVLTVAHYQEMHRWLKKVRVQMEDDVVVKDTFERTFYGFVYETEAGQLKCYFDAQKVPVYEKQASLMQKMQLTTPIFAQTYWFDNFSRLAKIKEGYREMMLRDMGGAYLALIKQIKTLAPAVDAVAFRAQLEKFRLEGRLEAAEAWQYYGYRWNVLA